MHFWWRASLKPTVGTSDYVMVGSCRWEGWVELEVMAGWRIIRDMKDTRSETAIVGNP